MAEPKVLKESTSRAKCPATSNGPNFVAVLFVLLIDERMPKTPFSADGKRIAALLARELMEPIN